MNYIAALQMNSFEGDINKNTIHIVDFLKEMKNSKENITLAVFPELCLYGYENLEKISSQYTQTDIDNSLKIIAENCRLTGIEAVVGAPYICKNGVENAQFFISNKGNITHVYSKTHLISCENNILIKGNKFGICSTSFGNAGFLICWDTAFPEAARIYGKSSAKFLIASAAWEFPYEHQWKIALCSRSFENCMPIIGANRVGQNKTTTFCGHSIITDCMGNILSEGDGKNEMFITAPLSEIFHIDKDFGLPIKELCEDIYKTDNIVERMNVNEYK